MPRGKENSVSKGEKVRVSVLPRLKNPTFPPKQTNNSREKVEFRARPSRDWVSMENGFERLAVWNALESRYCGKRCCFCLIFERLCGQRNDKFLYIIYRSIGERRIHYSLNILWLSRRFLSFKFLFTFWRTIFLFLFFFFYSEISFDFEKILSRERKIGVCEVKDDSFLLRYLLRKRESPFHLEMECRTIDSNRVVKHCTNYLHKLRCEQSLKRKLKNKKSFLSSWSSILIQILKKFFPNKSWMISKKGAL